MDDADITDARSEIEERLRRLERESRKHYTSDECLDCGEDIPEARQQATGGTQYCIDCAEIREKR